MAQRLLHVICYDIASSRIRVRVATRLEARGVRVQRSVYELWLTTAQARRLGKELSGMLAPGDSLRIYPLSRRSVDRVQTKGPGLAPRALGDVLLF